MERGGRERGGEGKGGGREGGGGKGRGRKTNEIRTDRKRERKKERKICNAFNNTVNTRIRIITNLSKIALHFVKALSPSSLTINPIISHSQKMTETRCMYTTISVISQ